MQLYAAGASVPASGSLIRARYERGPLVINLQLDPDAVTGDDLKRISAANADDSIQSQLKTAAEIVTLFIADWDADEPATVDYLFSLPVTLLTDLHNFCWETVCPLADDIKDLRRFLVTGGSIGRKPSYYDDIEDARILGLRPWEIDAVPVHWRLKARVVDLTKKQARAQIASKAQVPAAYQLEI